MAVVVPVVLSSLEAGSGRPTVKAVRAGSVAKPFAVAQAGLVEADMVVRLTS